MRVQDPFIAVQKGGDPLQILHSAALLLAFTMVVACDDLRFPRDPNGTLKTVLAEETMTVAFTDHSPWAAVGAQGEPQGAEVELIQAFAQQLGVAIDWKRLGAFAALEGLEQGDIQLAIGGFDREDVMPVSGAAPSYAYFEEEILLGARPDVTIPERLEGEQVFVPPHYPLSALVKEQGGTPVTHWGEDVAFAVVPRWQLASRDLRPTEIVLQRAKRVVAVQQGENAWLSRVERFLRQDGKDMDARLRANAP